MPLKGKTVYITGGTGGIGTPLVRRLTEAGAQVFCYDIEKHGDLVENVDEICSWLAENTPDILINMAGCNAFGYCENQNVEAIIDLNLVVPMRFAQAVLPAMKRRGSGRIVNMGSMTALIPLPHMSGYVASKAGLKGFSDSLRRELEDTGVSVIYIAPRAVRTPMNRGAAAEVNKMTGVAMDDPEDVAARIFEAIIRSDAEARIGWPERFFALLNSVFPAVVDKGLEKTRLAGEQVLTGEKISAKKAQAA